MVKTKSLQSLTLVKKIPANSIAEKKKKKLHTQKKLPSPPSHRHKN